MTFKGQRNDEVMVWRETVKHEDRALRDFERKTGQFYDSRLYQGQYKDDFAKTMGKGFWNYGELGFDHGNNPPTKEAKDSVGYIGYERPGRLKTAQSSRKNRVPLDGENPQNVTVWGRFNKKTPTTFQFSKEPYGKLFNFDRKQHVEMKDAIINRCQTVMPG
jgi:hypothetical protein